MDMNICKKAAADILTAEDLSTLKMEAGGSSEIFITVYKTARHHISEERNGNSYRHESFKSHYIL
jgi:hypothetical protein